MQRFRPGERIEDRYEVVRLLGRGGMGTALLVRDGKMDRDLVLKFPHLSEKDSPSVRERFRREIASLTRLSHPHIVRVLDAGDHGGTPFALFEFLAGGSLEDRLRRKGRYRFAIEDFAWLEPIADALDYLHGEGFLHRDVKPSNLLFHESGHACLADFGLVKIMAGTDLALTKTGAFPGSPAYMAPEFLEGEVGPAYDQYGLAGVVVRCLTGRMPEPFQGQRDVEALSSRGLSSEAQRVLLIALAIRPEMRFESCRNFALAFRKALAAGGELAPDGEEAGPDEPTRHL